MVQSVAIRPTCGTWVQTNVCLWHFAPCWGISPGGVTPHTVKCRGEKSVRSQNKKITNPSPGGPNPPSATLSSGNSGPFTGRVFAAVRFCLTPRKIHATLGPMRPAPSLARASVYGSGRGPAAWLGGFAPLPPAGVTHGEGLPGPTHCPAPRPSVLGVARFPAGFRRVSGPTHTVV